MKKYLTIAFLIFTSFLLAASEIIETPFLYDKEKQSIYIYAEIGNKKGYFLFDTGCSTPVVFDTPENYNNFKSVLNEGDSLYILNLEIEDKKYFSDGLMLGGNKLKIKHEFNVTDEPALTRFFPGVAGIIGLNIFKDKMFEISMTDSVIRIYNEKPDQYVLSSDVFIEDFKKNTSIVIPVYSGEKAYKALIDTGSFQTCLCAEQHNFQNTKKLNVKVFDSAGGHYKKDHFLIKETLDFMGITLENKIFRTHTIDGMPTDIIGMDILSYFDMLFDFTNQDTPMFYYKHRIPLKYFNLFIRNTINNDIRISILFDGTGNGVIEQLIENSPAWKAGLRPGTVITKLNSKSVLDYSINELKNLSNTVLKVTYIDDNGKEKTVKLKPKKML